MNTIDRFSELSGIKELRLKTKGECVKILIIDSGINKDSLINKDNLVESYNFVNKENSETDDINHGTIIANLIQTIAPMPLLYSAKVIGGNGEGSPQSLYNGLSLALEKKVDIVCLSLGRNSKMSPSTKQVIRNMINKGIIVCSASGNYNRNYLQSPADYNGVISVGGLSEDFDIKWSSSNYSTELDFVAPAENVESINSKGELCFVNGTSFANAIVVGQIALIKSIKPDISKDDILKLGSNDYRKLHFGMGYLNLKNFKG